MFLKPCLALLTAFLSFFSAPAAGKSPPPRQCLEDFSIETISRHEKPPVLRGTRSPLPGMLEALGNYYGCSAFIARKPDLCRELTRYQDWEVPLERVKTGNAPLLLEADCRSLYNLWTVIQLNVFRRPDAAQICQALPFSEEELGATDVKEECAWMLGSEPDAHCLVDVSPSLGKKEIEDCASYYTLHPGEKNCAAIRTLPLTEGARAVYYARCLDALAYRKAYKAKDAGLCGRSLACRALMGENVCRRHLDRLKEDYCRNLPP